MIQITIVLNEKGEVNVSGPLENKILCYGILEQAKELIKDFKPSPIIKPEQGDVIRMNGK